MVDFVTFMFNYDYFNTQLRSSLRHFANVVFTSKHSWGPPIDTLSIRSSSRNAAKVLPSILGLWDSHLETHPRSSHKYFASEVFTSKHNQDSRIDTVSMRFPPRNTVEVLLSILSRWGLHLKTKSWSSHWYSVDKVLTLKHSRGPIETLSMRPLPRNTPEVLPSILRWWGLLLKTQSRSSHWYSTDETFTSKHSQGRPIDTLSMRPSPWNTAEVLPSMLYRGGLYLETQPRSSHQYSVNKGFTSKHNRRPPVDNLSMRHSFQNTVEVLLLILCRWSLHLKTHSSSSQWYFAYKSFTSKHNVNLFRYDDALLTIYQVIKISFFSNWFLQYKTIITIVINSYSRTIS